LSIANAVAFNPKKKWSKLFNFIFETEEAIFMSVSKLGLETRNFDRAVDGALSSA